VDDASRIQAILAVDPVRWRLLEIVQSLALPDCWIGAGFVRNAVWDHLHGRTISPLSTDVDVIWFDSRRCNVKEDKAQESLLRALDSSVNWSVKNQARMHIQNGDAPYASTTDAISRWPETATAVAVRRLKLGEFEVTAPLGLSDLFGLVVRPTESFATGKRAIYQQRLESKRWLSTWPLLTLASAS
jgi:hypothetical protein